MSQFCPLCGKNKSEKALFCDDCKNKIEKEYEVDVPEDKESVDNILDEKVEFENKDEDLSSEIAQVSIKPQRSKRNWFIWLLILGILLVVGFFY